MVVKLLDFSREEYVEKWNNFVFKFSKLYLHSNWAKILSSIYGFKPYYLYIEEKGEIISVFPLIYVKLPLFKDELVSIPHVESGGIFTPELYSLYFAFIFHNIKPKRLRIYQCGEPLGNFTANTSEVIVILKLPERKEDIISNIKSEPMRRSMRRTLEQKHEVIIGSNNELLHHFYTLYLLKMKEFGTPPHGFKFMKCITDAYNDSFVIILIKSKNEYVGAGFYIQFNECLYNLYFVVPGKFLREKVGYILEYTSMKIAVEKSLKYIVRGRSVKDSGTYLYKIKLGGNPEQLYIYNFKLTPQGYESLEAKTVKERYHFAPKIWSAMPPFFTNKVGPFVRKWVY